MTNFLRAAAILAALLSAAPARATSVGDIVAAHAVLAAADGRSGPDYVAWRAAHTPELLAATRVLELGNMAFEAVLQTTYVAAALYGVPLMCNFDEETRVGDDVLVAEYLADGQARFGLDAVETRRRLFQADWQEVLAQTLLRHYRCR